MLAGWSLFLQGAVLMNFLSEVRLANGKPPTHICITIHVAYPQINLAGQLCSFRGSRYLQTNSSVIFCQDISNCKVADRTSEIICFYFPYRRTTESSTELQTPMCCAQPMPWASEDEQCLYELPAALTSTLSSTGSWQWEIPSYELAN